MKRTFLNMCRVICLTLFVQFLFACSSSTEEEVPVVTPIDDFEMVIDPLTPNFVLLKNISTEPADSVRWIYNKKTVTGVGLNEFEAYFPNQGTYTVEMNLFRPNSKVIKTKEVIIYQNDPDYLSHYKLVWSDEFDGTQLNSSNWVNEVGATGWGNQELQNYTYSDNHTVKDGIFTITAKKVNDLTQTGSYTSARVKSQRRAEFLYGRIEVRAKLPSGRGTWPAIWMLGANLGSVPWPTCGEIDIMEYVGYDPNIIHSTVHTLAASGGSASGNSKNVTTCEEEFHVYGILWEEKSIVFYVDQPSNIVHTYAPNPITTSNWPFSKPQFFILNLAIGGSWGGREGVDNSIFPQDFMIDYVRVYQLE